MNSTMVSFGENLSFCFLLASPPFGFLFPYLNFFLPLVLFIFLLLSSPLPFCFFPMPSPFIFSTFIPTFFNILLWLLILFLFCFPFSFVFALCFFLSFFVLTPQFSFFLLLAPLHNLANIFPFLLSFFPFFPPLVVLIAISCPSLPCLFGWPKKFGCHWTYPHCWMVTEIL